MFLNALRERGFTVAERATANYLKTAHSIASSLNMDELDADALADESSAPDDWTPLYRRLQTSHAVERFLHARGYRYLHLGLRRGATYTNDSADAVFTLGYTTEFSSVLADTTILVGLQEILPDELATGTDAFYPAQTLFQLDKLEEIAHAPGLNFVFGHLLLPHPPYAFNADGSRVTAEQCAPSRTDDELYIEQLQYANARILRLLDRLACRTTGVVAHRGARSRRGPVSPAVRRRRGRLQVAGGDARRAPSQVLDPHRRQRARRRRARTSAAAGFSDTVTPVNLLRAVFNAAFDAGLPMLPDRNWVFVDQEPYLRPRLRDRSRQALSRLPRCAG